MNWDAVAAIGEIVGAGAVLITLVYLAIQIKHLKKQTESTTLDHIIDALNDFAGRIAESDSLASIINRGRASYDSLDDDEKIRFEMIHMFLLNNLESWYLQQKNLEEVMGEHTFENIESNIRYFCEYPGFREFWEGARPVYPNLSVLMDKILGNA